METMNFKSQGHEEFLELCAASVSERLTREERMRLSKHLDVCDACRNALGQYRAIEKFALPAAASENSLEQGTVFSLSVRQEDKVLGKLLRQCAAGDAPALQPQ